MKIFKKCVVCNKSLWRQYDTFKLNTLEGEHVVYICKPQCWVNEHVESDEEFMEIDDDNQPF